MSRADLTAHDRAQRSRPNYWMLQQAQYQAGGAVITPPVDATVRYIAVPPIGYSYGPTGKGTQGQQLYGPTAFTTGPVLGTNNPFGRPGEAWLYSGQEFYLALDTAADTQFAAFMPKTTVHKLTINPGVNTLSWLTPTANASDVLRLNWLWSF